jgi:hypothetical protein
MKALSSVLLDFSIGLISAVVETDMFIEIDYPTNPFQLTSRYYVTRADESRKSFFP